MTTAVIRVELPYHLQNLAHVGPEISIEVTAPITASSLLDAIEARYPMLCGTIRDHVTKQRRAFVRYFGCQQDLSHDSPDSPLPDAIVNGTEPFIIWGRWRAGSQRIDTIYLRDRAANGNETCCRVGRGRRVRVGFARSRFASTGQ